MPLRCTAIAVFLSLVASCGSEGASALGPGDYFTQLGRISENAHIQERGLAHDLRVRLERADAFAERMDVVEVYVGQSVRLYRDVIDALVDLEPAEGLEGPHDAYVGAWQGQLDLALKVRDAGFHGVAEYLEALHASAFRDARLRTKARCEDLQAAVAAAGRELDLLCDGRPS